MTATSPTPFDRTAEFATRVAAHKGEAWAQSWLNRQNCVFGATTVWTTGFGRERLLDECGSIAKACGVSIVEGVRMNANPGSDAVLMKGAA